jgi:single-stranded-DNA-specific exonuclease
MYELAMLDDEDHVPNMIFSYDDKYHEGVIGLVAAKLVQKYYRPAVVISLDGDVGKGSVRSIPGINIIDILREFEEMFVNVGGHPMAAGFTIEKKNIKKLEDKLLDYAANNFSDEVLVPEIEVDMKIPMSVIDVPILDEIDKMKPFGVGNNEPDFFSDDVGILELRKVGKEKNHNLFKFFYDGKNYKGIWFNSSDNGMVFKLGDKADVVYTLKRNEFNGKVSVDLFIKDMKKCIGKKSD